MVYVGEVPPMVQESVTGSDVRSQSGRVVANSLTSGAQGYAARYQFDAASRMTQATLSVNGVTDHVLDYGFASTGTACADANITGAVTNPGANGSRITFSDAHTVGGVTSTASTTYCYDAVDRLLGSVVSGDLIPTRTRSLTVSPWPTSPTTRTATPRRLLIRAWCSISRTGTCRPRSTRARLSRPRLLTRVMSPTALWPAPSRPAVWWARRRGTRIRLGLMCRAWWSLIVIALGGVLALLLVL